MAIYKKPNLTSAIDAEGNWKHVNEVDSGLSCNCFCPHCRARLIAINSKPEGESKAHHFAHERGSDCIWSDESSLHKLAKEVLTEEQKVMLPTLNGETAPVLLDFDSVEQESRDPQTGLIPDCVCYYGGQKLWVEFKRTHEVDSKKAEKIRNAKIDCIEIDLNVCEISKEAVRKFIVEESSNRIWVYNSKTQQTKTWKEKGERSAAEYSEHEYIVIDRHFAFDENAYLVNLFEVKPNYDLSAHKYYCVNCGRELRINQGRFEHIEENKKCIDDIYLLHTAREVIYNSFYNHKKYEITVPKYHFCENIETCEFADKNRCFVEGHENYDLKSFGYKMCEKAVKVPGQNELYDIVLRKPVSLENAVVVNLSTEDCDRDLDTNFRQVEIHISSESDLVDLAKTLNIGYCRNFNEESSEHSTADSIQAPILKFSLYRSGKSFIGPVPCTSYKTPRNREVTQEYVFSGEIPSFDKVRLLSLITCYKNKLKGCYCEICAYLKRNPGYHPICIRYKTQGTPRNPLESKPCDCLSFRLNIDLEADVLKECEAVKMIEIPKENIQ